jgi:lipoic acid synthetase
MAAALPRYRCVSCGLASIKRPSRLFAPIISRGYATTDSPSSPASTRRRETKFSDKLNAGPAFDDFVGGKEEPITPEDALELRTALVGPKGKQKKITRLPEWLKTPIPDGNNFKKIKNDLRGLGLHTGRKFTNHSYTIN